MKRVFTIKKRSNLKPDYDEAYLKLGEILIRQNRWQEAIDNYHHSLGENPQNTKILANLGSALSETGRFKEAITVYRQAININPNNPILNYRIGDMFARQGDTAQASEYYRRAVQLETTNIQLETNNLGETNPYRESNAI